jgi:transposase
MPLYRQSAMLKRDTGLDINRSTMDGWVMRVGELLLPLVGVMRRELLGGAHIQADETPVDVQMRDGRGQNHQAYLWQYGTPGGSVVFDFRLGRGREGPKQFLQQFDGILQTDGYAAYDRIGGPKIIHAVCRVGEDVAILTPHGPGRADFPHPVLHGRVSLPTM